MPTHALPLRPLRSAMYVPATNPRALAKATTLDCDAVIYDLEDAVAPDMKDTARQHLVQVFASARPSPQQAVIRVNAIDSAAFEQDMATVAYCRPDAVLVPKIGSARDVQLLSDAAARHGAAQDLRLWLMVETAAALSALDDIVQAGLAATPRLDCLVVGTNDIAKETGVFAGDGRRYLMPWLMGVVLTAKRSGVRALDGVWNDFSDAAGFEVEARQSVKMAFDGKTLIHPTQIGPANAAFSPSESAVSEARDIVAAFAREEHAGTGVINLNGKMVERLHLAQAQRLLAVRSAIDARATTAR
ncbi:CoA ester lyase [Variovorax paradoxus]|uniref:CoA ester lyase n=1 Tax=Variovorax paradoxus TaxID=34073 RepID=A0A5Q0M3H1_VARPD|nr:CoA ester lyase [Variovorax paradoxus]QFZ83999.1 CoA ester lyase [Variovorax paradoxus]